MVFHEDVYIFGAGGFGREVEALCHRNGIYVLGFIGKNESYNCLYRALVAISDPFIRYNVVESIIDAGGIFLDKLVDKDAILTDPDKTWIGVGSIICPGAILTTNIHIGNFCQIHVGSTIGHDTILNDYVTMVPGVNVGGNVSIGELCYLGANVSVKEGVNICVGVTVGMGSVVIRDITEPGTYVGVPARRIK
jgi:sugar O-acyltransferase (sialic acid O-acetyltransferase NeuD family)